MPKSHKYLIVYDISNQKERNKVSKILAGYGERVQESVFECRLSVAMRQRLTEKLETLEVATGFILLYRLFDNAKRSIIGAAPSNICSEETHSFIV